MNWILTGILSTWVMVVGFLPSHQSIDQQLGKIEVPSAPQPAVSSPVAGISQLTQSKGVLVTDLATGNTLFERESESARPMASLTKMMTAYVILSRHELNETLKVPEEIRLLSGTNSQIVGLTPGDTITVEQALRALMIYSANDAAVSLAVHDAGSQTAFVDRMNQTAQQLGLSKTHFANPHGLDAPGHVSTPADLTQLGRIILTSPTLTKIVRTPSSSITTGQGKVLRLTTTNQLLTDPLVQGLKTGYTQEAGQCLITYSKDESGREIMTVVLDSPDRFAETSRVIHYLLD